jgi:vanillate O-demethylase monooxygenase subunit
MACVTARTVDATVSRPAQRRTGRPVSRHHVPDVEQYGLVWTCLDSEDGHADIPAFPQWTDESFQPILCPPVSMAAAPGRQIEDFIDVAHFAWIHHEAFADRENSVVPLYKTRMTDYGIQSEYISNVSNFPKALRHLEPEGFIWRRVFDIHPPFVAFLTVDFPDDGMLKIMNIASPVSARETTLYVPLVRNFDRPGRSKMCTRSMRRFSPRIRTSSRLSRPRIFPRHR